MDWSYSPHREAGGILHVPSPQHSPHYDAIAIQKLRRSLSRSPSKPTRLQLSTRSPNASPHSPLSPFEVVRAVSPILAKENRGLSTSWSPIADARNTPKPKFPLRRVAPFRSSPRLNNAGRSPMRRVLSDTSNQGNLTPGASRRSSGDENTSSSSSEKSSPEELRTKTPASLLTRNDERPPIFEFTQHHASHLSTMAEHFTPARSSPLKRVDGRISLDQPNFGTPAKRRSLHGASSGNDFDIFAQSTMGPPPFEPEAVKPLEQDQSYSPFGSPVVRRATAMRKSSHLRQTPAPSRHRFSLDPSAESATPLPSIGKSRQRMSLDSTFLVGPQQESPFVKPAPRPAPSNVVFGQRSSLSRSTVGQPHPLSNALTASSSGSSLTDSSPENASTSFPAPPMAPRSQKQHIFAKSLPLGVPRPTESFSSQDSQASFETPELYKFGRPQANSFFSTGVISKKNRNVEVSNEPVYQMPDTPSKRASFPPVTGSPFPSSAFKKIGRPKLDFGVPAAPFGGLSTTPAGLPRSGEMFPSISNSSLARKHSFISNDGDDQTRSPSGQHDSQSSADELPPTPTKPAGKKEKENSLRSSLFGRRTSLNPDTFVPPGAVDVPGATERNGSKSPTLSYVSEEEDDIEIFDVAEPESPSTMVREQMSCSVDEHKSKHKAKRTQLLPAMQRRHSQPYANFGSPIAPSGSDAGRQSPHTPLESFTPPDPSRLSISAGQSKWGGSFNSSTMSNGSFPPATPTAQRDYHFAFAATGAPVAVQGVTNNDVDSSLTARFTDVVSYGNGEFSQVFRVQGRIDNPLAPSSGSSRNGVWAVKKAKKAFTGPRDRERRYQEVHILKAMKGNDHIIDFVDSWDSKGHLYIQTEFCEDGNLREFSFRHGSKGRLDDFRIWKILLELSLGVKHIHNSGFIHLDLKPANVLIDFEGVLKIADFGLASSWPAPSDIDGEGDREYMAAEILQGRYDKPADVYALGIMILEIAANMELPSYGDGWQRLRHGNLANIPSLTFSSASTLPRNDSGDPISPSKFLGSDDTNPPSDDSTFSTAPTLLQPRPDDLVEPPVFMIDAEDLRSLDAVVCMMLQENPDMRPTIDQVYQFEGVQWVERRRRAGATIYEGPFGPSDQVLGLGVAMMDGDVDMTDV